jgi:hypothetical protein
MKPIPFLLVLTVGLAVGLWACQDLGVVVPDDAVGAPHELVTSFVDCSKNPTHPKCGGGEDDEDDGAVGIDLTGAYRTDASQPATLRETAKRITISATVGDEIEYQLDPGTLDFSTYFGGSDCRAGGVNAIPDKEAFWDAFLAAQVPHTDRTISSYIDARFLGEPAAEHHSNGFWFTEHLNASLDLPLPLRAIDDDPDLDRLMWRFKIGTSSSLFDKRTGPRAVATWDGSAATYTDGMVKLEVINCGPVAGETGGCGPPEGSMAVACDNRGTGVSFTITVDRDWTPS